MKDINTLRDTINTIDNDIMALLDQRFEIVKAIGLLKQSKKAPIEDHSREKAIISKTSTYNHKEEIQAIYDTVFTVSKNLQRK